jgi:excisionase family DNA binding protein
MVSQGITTSDWLTVSEVADRLRVSTDSVYLWLADGALIGVKFGRKRHRGSRDHRRWRIHRTAVEAFESGGKPERKPSRAASFFDVPDVLTPFLKRRDRSVSED